MSLADDIRAYAYEHSVAPQLTAGTLARVRASDIHKAMGFSDRIPAVVSALGGAIFQSTYGLRLVERLGRPVSTATEFVFAGPEQSLTPAGTLSPAHLEALRWFEEHSGQTVPWAALNDRQPKLAIIPKGIYRPAGWRHSISIKIIAGGGYPDEEPALHDGRLRFRYHQEEPKGANPAKHSTNLGLGHCMADGVPVGVIRRVKPKPGPLYEVLGLGQVLAWEGGFFTIELLDGAVEDQPGAVHAEPAPLIAPQTMAPTPEPVSLEDARQRIAQAIVRRRGQAKFRADLIKAYGGRCAISGCAVAAVLEAAHIKPYLGSHTNVVQNGLLLRGDLHTLFDLKLLRIEPKTRRVAIAEALRGTEYSAFEGRLLTAPAAASDAPAADCLDYAWSAASVGTEDGVEVSAA